MFHLFKIYLPSVKIHNIYTYIEFQIILKELLNSLVNPMHYNLFKLKFTYLVKEFTKL